jgi:CheY-like chemotaxis protein
MRTSVLWADCNSVFTVLGQHYLEAAGISVNTAQSAVECIRQLKVESHDILILDDSLLWGGIDGILWWIDDTVPIHEQPQVIVSGVDTPEKLSSRTGVPAERCLQKPYRLMTVLEAVLSAKQSLSARGFEPAARGSDRNPQWQANAHSSAPLEIDIAVKARNAPLRFAERIGAQPSSLSPARAASMTVCGIKDVVAEG